MLCENSIYGAPGSGHCFKQLIFWGSQALWPLLIAVLIAVLFHRKPWRRSAWISWAVVSAGLLLMIDMRFIERWRLVEHHTELRLGFRARIALISDVHVGLFRDESDVARLVQHLNGLDLEFVLVAGDWTYEPTRPLSELLAPLAELRHPILSVPGNHDEGFPGPPIQKPLREALIKLRVLPIEGRTVDLVDFTLVGLGDHLASKDGLAALHAAPRDKPIIVLTHEPDTAMTLPPGSASLVLAGHTHGGQVRLPFIGWVVNASKHPFDRGLHPTLAPVPTFVTSGLGETMLPLRLLNPPVIDVLTIR